MARHEKPTNEMLGFIEDEYGALSIDDIVIPPPPVATLSHDVPDKRLIITKLKIKNFKSYAGEIVLGPFNKNFTAVVGPNGSGKSNVIDSLLFVFGYRAKKIRSKKVSYLIHKSDQHPNLNSCTVTVNFATIKENGDKYEIISDSTFMLSRTAFSDDSSYYEMNGKRAPYKEVSRALRQYGIDLEHSRFLILQGEIEAISLMQPKGPNEHETGMLEYIEDIIGSNRYIEPIQKLKEKLEKMTEEKNEKLHILKLVEKDKEDLEDPKNKAIEYLRLENRVIMHENSILHSKRMTSEKELEEVVKNKQLFVDTLNELKTQINKMKASRKSQETELEKISSELETHLKNCEKYKEAYKSLERDDIAMHEEIKHLKTKKSKIDTSITTTKNELSKLNKQIEVFESETKELQIMKNKLDAEKLVEEKKMSEVMDSMQKETNTLQEKKDKFEAQLIKMKKEVDHLKSEMALLKSELDIYLRNDTKEKQFLSNLMSNFEKTEKNAKEEDVLLKKEKEQISSIEIDLQNLNQQIKTSQSKEISLGEQLKSGRLKLEEAKNSLTNFRHRSGVMQAFAKEKACGRMTGVYGRLGDLGAIDEKYDVAISTACGALDNIVTDTVATAQECIQFLKQKNLGYVTFIPIEKMRKFQGKRQGDTATPENAPRLFDLVRVKDENLLVAFYHALGETLVCHDLEQATRLAYKQARRYRVVTHKGEIIESSGAMSGGGGRVLRGRMGQTVVDECSHSPEEVSKISSEVEHLSRSLYDIRKLIVNLQEQVAKKTRELSGLQLSIKKRQSNYKAYVASVEMMKMQIVEQKKKMEESVIDEDKVQELKEKIETKNKSYSSSAKEASAVEEKVSKLQAEILKITKGSLGKVKQNVDQLTKKISEVSQSITKSVVNAKTCKRNTKKAEDKIKNLEKEFEAAKEAKTKLNANRDSTVVKAREFLSKQEKAQVEADQLKERKTKLKKELETFHEQEHQMKLTEIKHKNEQKEIEGAETEKRAIIKSINTKLTKLKLNEVEDDSTEISPLSTEEIEKVQIKRIVAEMELFKAQMEDMKPDLSSIKEYKIKEKVCNEKQQDLDNIVHERNMQNMRYDELRKRRLSEFMKAFTAIAKKLKEIYQMLTLGGDAEMELVDTFDPFSKGIEFSVRPPKKSWKFMRNLSGGEKTLSSLALVFALHYYRPTPFYVMDEIDAALDVRNVAIVGYYLKERTKNTQFIIVSLRNIMNELSDHLIGIYKTDNCSKNISIMNTAQWGEEVAEGEHSHLVNIA